ncbi:MAG: tetratricopeptide repeat protein [Desulfobacterales bacterium]
MKSSAARCIIVLFLAVFSFYSCATTPQESAERIAEAEAVRRLGEAYLSQGNYTAALREFLKAEKLSPNDHFLHYDLGIAYIEKKLYPEAIRHLSRANELKPDYAPARNSLGNAYILNGDYDKAIDALETLINDESFNIYSTPHFPRNNLGWAYYYKGEYAKAEKSFLGALQIYDDGFQTDMTYLSVLRGLGLTCMAADRPDEAVTYLERAIRTAPRVQELHMDLGRAYEMSGDRNLAVQSYRKVREINPATKVADDALLRIRGLESN